MYLLTALQSVCYLPFRWLFDPEIAFGSGTATIPITITRIYRCVDSHAEKAISRETQMTVASFLSRLMTVRGSLGLEWGGPCGIG